MPQVAGPLGRPKVDFVKRLKEIDLFFQHRDPVHQAMRRLVQRLKKAGITYAIAGAMAVNAHGAERTTRDVDVLLTPEGLERFRQEMVGKFYDQEAGRSRRFRERKTGVGIDVLVTGRYPGFGSKGPFPFPDPLEASEVIRNKRVLTLPFLVQLKLAARRYYDFGDVVFLIRVHELDESFAEQLHPAVRHDYIECLEEKRREDDYIAREG